MLTVSCGAEVCRGTLGWTSDVNDGGLAHRPASPCCIELARTCSRLGVVSSLLLVPTVAEALTRDPVLEPKLPAPIGGERVGGVAAAGPPMTDAGRVRAAPPTGVLLLVPTVLPLLGDEYKDDDVGAPPETSD